MADVIDFGDINQGAYVIFTFTFKQNVTTPGTGTPANPGAGAFVNMTPPHGVKTDYTASLAHAGPGLYTLTFSAMLPGPWTGSAYAPPGSGQDAQPFQFMVLKDKNYGA